MQGQTSRTIIRRKLSRALRNRPTDAERHLWQFLRGRQLAGCKFRRQHPYGDYILDFVCLERKVVVELDGGQHADQQAYDLERTRFLESAGFSILRFWNHDVFANTDGIIDVIMQTLSDTPSPPNPPLEGEG